MGCNKSIADKGKFIAVNTYSKKRTKTLKQ